MYYSSYKIGGELYHHGILGQKWGHKNGPPYPLGGSDHSASERKAGWKKSLGGGKIASTKKKKKELVDKTKEKDTKKKINNKIDEIDEKMKELTRVTEKYEKGHNEKTIDDLNRTYAEYELLVDDAMKHIDDYSRKERKYIKKTYDKLSFPDDEISNKYREEAKKKKKEKELAESMRKLEEYRKMMKEDGEDPDESIKTSSKAHNKTLEWYKKNDPKALKKMLNEVGGKEGDLDKIHDFRKTKEGYESELIDKKRRR